MREQGQKVTKYVGRYVEQDVADQKHDTKALQVHLDCNLITLFIHLSIQ